MGRWIYVEGGGGRGLSSFNHIFYYFALSFKFLIYLTCIEDCKTTYACFPRIMCKTCLKLVDILAPNGCVTSLKFIFRNRFYCVVVPRDF
jgi:hypothetical protein